MALLTAVSGNWRDCNIIFAGIPCYFALITALQHLNMMLNIPGLHFSTMLAFWTIVGLSLQ